MLLIPYFHIFAIWGLNQIAQLKFQDLVRRQDFDLTHHPNQGGHSLLFQK